MSDDSSPSPRRKPRIHPLWFWVTGAFLFLIAAWSTLIWIATHHPTEAVEVEDPSVDEAAP
ncbi:MAG: hypothetical protein ACLFR7_00975 [Opitutales bacterium]